MKLHTLRESTKTVSHSLLTLWRDTEWHSKPRSWWRKHVRHKSLADVSYNRRVYSLKLRRSDLLGFTSAIGMWVFDIFKHHMIVVNNKTVGGGNGKDWLLMQSFLTWWKTTDVDRHTLLKPHAGYFHSLRTGGISTGRLQAKTERILFNINHTAFALMPKRNK